jgi:hypothetical protein
MMNQPRQIAILVGLGLMALLSLFPPRKPSPHARTANFVASRVFLFSPSINQAERQARSSDGVVVTLKEAVEIDAGRLLAELALVVAACGIWCACSNRWKTQTA